MYSKGSLRGGIGGGCPGVREYDHEGSSAGRVSCRDKFMSNGGSNLCTLKNSTCRGVIAKSWGGLS